MDVYENENRDDDEDASDVTEGEREGVDDAPAGEGDDGCCEAMATVATTVAAVEVDEAVVTLEEYVEGTVLAGARDVVGDVVVVGGGALSVVAVDVVVVELTAEMGNPLDKTIALRFIVLSTEVQDTHLYDR